MGAELVTPPVFPVISPLARALSGLWSADAGPLPRFVCTGICATLGLSALLPGLAAPLVWLMVLGAYVAGGLRTTLAAAAALRGGTPDINLLMILAAIVSAAIGHWGEGAILLFLFSLSDALERHAVEGTRRSIRGLMNLRPETARLVRDGREIEVPPEQLEPGDQVRVRPGERFPVDGAVVEGRSTVDQSIVTGESMPVDKVPGDEVFAGTINANGTLLVRMTRPAAQSTLARIVRLIEEAQERKAPFERFIDRFQKPYVLGVLLACVAVMFIKLIASSGNVDYAIYSGMVLLVAASPCALVLASPVAVLATVTRAAKLGVLYKGGALIEQLARIETVAFDKTGTLTIGRPTVASILPADGTRADELLRVAAGVEHLAEHPLAKAIVAEAARRELPPAAAQDFRSIPGVGVSAIVEGRAIRISRPAALQGSDDPRNSELTRLVAQAGDATAVVIEQPGGVAGVITFRDQARPEAVATLAALRRLGVREFVMLTGDHGGPARRVGAELGITNVLAELLPQDKLREVHRLARCDGGVIMVGDGVNDAPALAAATIGVAMGAAGSDVAIETADVVLMRSDLRALAEAIHLARRCRTAIQQGLLIAAGAIALLVGGSLFGLPLPLAVVGHEGSTLVVILNGLRILQLPPLVNGAPAIPATPATPAPR